MEEHSRGPTPMSREGSQHNPSRSRGTDLLSPFDDEGIPFTGWSLYFPGQDFSIIADDNENPTIALIENLINHFRTTFQQQDIEGLNSVPMDFVALRDALDLSCNFVDHLLNKPLTLIPCLELALHQIGVGRYSSMSSTPQDNLDENGKKRKNLMAKYQPSKKLNARIYNYEPKTSLRSLKSNLINKFVSVRGTVIRVSNVKPTVLRMNFRCIKCNSIQTKHFTDGKYSHPIKCNIVGCKSRTFDPDRNSAITIDFQRIRLQEETDQGKESGRVPRTIEIELTDDLVDSCVPGDIITVCGIVKMISVEPEKGNPKNGHKNKATFLLYIDANSVDNSKQIDTGKMDLMDFSIKDMYAILEVAKEKNLFNQIVNSICPGIYGHELVKAGLVLSLFGGSSQKGREGERGKMPVRSDPHILIVGDPGLGKSQMLQAINYISPRGVYVCGGYSTTTGLTVSLLRESGSGDYALEAGALVLGDQGTCCIDEFDKMPAEHAALLEAMEQQSVSIAKAGIVANLPARTSVIAAANPVGGHYDKAKTVSENLKMGTALLSRFDLIFILLDRPDEKRDQLLSEHVMSLHGGRFKKEEPFSQLMDTPSRRGRSGRDYLSAKLKPPPKESGFEIIPPQILRKYIGYAKKYVAPRLSEDASEVLKEFYLKLRREHKNPDTTPITTRQLESMIRLSEARAKLELREVITTGFPYYYLISLFNKFLFSRFIHIFTSFPFLFRL
eukprot:TRINITY_DN3601_c0_g2_i1.p1 TRINITY_DN3601_c0_g2~~TRINITY_DN3601_c0_g2_i1.p1  ORF type:complete len:728 (+),score=149.30 TRINITY_DN3601_c0_g2_i1:149-2332(+)